MFTSLSNPIVETDLRRQMDLIVSDTTRVYGRDCSIILAGSFGRGEGSVRIDEGGNPVPLNDFDVYVITNKKVDPRIHLEMEEQMVKELSQMIGYNLARDNFVVGVEVVPRRSLKRLPPDISAYEMKAASHVLYGPDLRGLIPITSKDIALGSGAITLFHRTIALLENVEPEYLARRDYPEDRRLETVRETCKVYTEICTSLSLIGGFYKPSYRARAKELGNHYHKFPDLARIIPNLPTKVARGTELKIKSDFAGIKDEAEEKWLEARRDLSVCQRYFLSKMLGIKFDQEWKRFCDEAGKKLKWLFFYDYLSFLLRQRGIRGAPFVYGANMIFQAYDSYSFNRRIREFAKASPSGPFSLNSPLQRIYLATAAVLYSLQDDGGIDESLLAAGWNYLGRVFQLAKPNLTSPHGWKLARHICLDAQKLYFIREQKRGL
jgi:hypothetical protein